MVKKYLKNNVNNKKLAARLFNFDIDESEKEVINSLFNKPGEKKTFSTKPFNRYFFNAVEAGEIKIIVSPLKNVSPKFLLISPFSISFMLSRTRFM